MLLPVVERLRRRNLRLRGWTEVVVSFVPSLVVRFPELIVSWAQPAIAETRLLNITFQRLEDMWVKAFDICELLRYFYLIDVSDGLVRSTVPE